MPTVFISYRHENPAHSQRVRDLALRLRTDGLDVIYDGFEEEKNHGMAPPAGWPLWSINNASTADFVIIAASRGWFDALAGSAPDPAGGRGAAAEAECIATRMYRDKVNVFAAMTYFDRVADLDGLPPYLEKCSRLDALSADDLARIVRWVQGGPSLPAPAAPVPVPVWPASIQFPEDALADRLEHRECFCDMLTGAAADRIVCVIARSGAGKSKLLKVLKEAASAAFAANGRVAYLRHLHEQKSAADFAGTICSALGSYPQFPRYEQCISEGKPEAAQILSFLSDLKRRTTPSLIILDTWEKASEEVRRWITGHLVPAIHLSPAVKLVIAGREEAEYPAAQPGQIRHLTLHDIQREDWHEFIDRRYTAEAAALKPMIDLCLARAHGVKAIANILEILEKGEFVA